MVFDANFSYIVGVSFIGGGTEKEMCLDWV